MSCCGSKRQSFFSTSSSPAARSSFEAPAERIAAPAAVFFINVGQTSLTAIGRATGRRYRFDAPGSRMGVDPRDAESLASVPGLKRAHRT